MTPFLCLINNDCIVQKYRDAEAKLIRHLGQDRWECLLYVICFDSIHQSCFSLILASIRPNGKTFVAPVATSVKWECKPNDIVTFKHNGFLLGSQIPKAPTIYRLRSDKTWDEVVASFAEHDDNHLSTGNC
jgi:hypothetical protein